MMTEVKLALSVNVAKNVCTFGLEMAVLIDLTCGGEKE